MQLEPNEYFTCPYALDMPPSDMVKYLYADFTVPIFDVIVILDYDKAFIGNRFNYAYGMYVPIYAIRDARVMPQIDKKDKLFEHYYSVITENMEHELTSTEVAERIMRACPWKPGGVLGDLLGVGVEVEEDDSDSEKKDEDL